MDNPIKPKAKTAIQEISTRSLLNLIKSMTRKANNKKKVPNPDKIKANGNLRLGKN